MGASPGPNHRIRTVHTGMAARWGAPVVHAHAARGAGETQLSLGPVAPPRCLGRPYGCPNEPRWPARASLAGNARAMVHSGACAMAGRGAAEGDRGIRSRGTKFLT